MTKFRHHIFVCGNHREAGHPRGCCDPEGNQALRAAFKAAVKSRGLRGDVRANRAGCLDQCEHGPCVVIYPEAVWYGGVRLQDVDLILDQHILGGTPVSQLTIADDCINNRDCPHRLRSRKLMLKEEGKEAMSSEVKVRNDGPLVVSGEFELVDAEGSAFGLGGRDVIALCRCGHSDNKPFCDGSHNRAGFQAESKARDLPPKP